MRPENLLQQLHQRTQKCSVGCPVLDRCLGGGVPCNSVTELVAESGCGKTQFCLQLVLSAQLPPSHGGLLASSLYIHTEFPFPIRRLRQLSRAFRSSNPDLLCVGDDPCDRVFVKRVFTAEQLVETLPMIELFLMYSRSRYPLRVIVIDSIAALFRSDFDNTGLELRRRSSLFFKISGGLKSLAKRFGLAVVVTNHVVDLIGGGGEREGESEGVNSVRIGNMCGMYSSGRRVCPALGIAWANCVNSRLFLSRDEEADVDDDGRVYQRTRMRRRLSVVFAPHLPESSCEFVIKGEGVFGVEMQQKESSVADCGIWNGTAWSWALSWRRTLHEWESQSFMELQVMLSEAVINRDIKDQVIWKFHQSGMFSVRVFVQAVEGVESEQVEIHNTFKNIWNGWAHPRAELVVWFALLGKLKPKEALARRNILSANECG